MKGKTPGLTGHLNDRFQGSVFGLDDFFETVSHLLEFQMVSDPGVGVDDTVFNQLDDTGKIRGQGVPRSEQIDFLAVKSRVFEGDFLSGDAYVYQAAGVSDEIKSSGHRMGVAGGVGDQIKERTISSYCLKFLL